MSSRRILVVNYPYPPAASVGGVRWSTMAKYLRRMGHRVSILTTTAFGTLEDDHAAGVWRSRDLAAHGGLRRALRRPPPPVAGEAGAAHREAPRAFTRIVVPDLTLLGWGPFALPAARRLIRDQRIDCLVTSSPPESTHIVGLALGRRRPAWVADLRDGWTFEPDREPFPTAPQRALERRQERRVAATAEVVTSALEPVAADLRDRLGVDARHVPNGWDPELDDEVDELAIEGLLDPDSVNLVLTGTLVGTGWRRDVRALLRALAQVASEQPRARGLRLVIAGVHEPWADALIAEHGVGSLVSHVGQLDRGAAIALQRRADALLLPVAAGTAHVPAKLYEYLVSGRPIVALAAAGSATDRIVRETGAGIVVEPDEVEAIAGVLRRMLGNELDDSPRAREIERYVYPRPAVEMAEAITLSVERRAEALRTAHTRPRH